MKVKEINVKLIKYMELSDSVKEEINPNPINNSIFWVKVPKSIQDMKTMPSWNELCKEQDFKSGEYILVEINWK